MDRATVPWWNGMPHTSGRNEPTTTVPFDPYPPDLATCRRCPRLAAFREEIARTKRRAYRDQEYWGAPVPGFGDPDARLLIVGLAPGAHGSNRTGRMFTGDASGTFLYASMHRLGLASQPTSVSRSDGLRLTGAWITASARCVPPGNKPTPDELATCMHWLKHDFDGLRNVTAILALGRIGHDSVLRLYRERGLRATFASVPFAHGAVHRLDELPGGAEAGARPLVDAFHVSLQNTNTGRLTSAMFDEALAVAKSVAGLD